jgi:hypothetical protein
MKALIMFVRLVGVTAIILGAILWNSGEEAYLALHIGVGFLLVTLLIVLAVFGVIRKAVVPGVVAIVLALLLPVVGFLQLQVPLSPRAMHGMQLAHFVIALTAVGMAERLYAAIRSAD